MDRHFSTTSAEQNSVPWFERQTLKTLGLFLPRAVRERQIHEWQDHLECARAAKGDLGRELMQMVRSTPSLAWSAVPSVFRVSLPPLATAIMAALVLWPGGRIPPAAGADYAVRLWDVRTHKQVGGPLIGHTGPVVRVAFSRDGRTLASASEDGTVRLWDARTHKQLGAPLTGQTGPVVSLAFSADGRTLTSLSEDGTVQVWQGPKQLRAARTGHTGPVSSVVFRPDGRTLGATSDRTIRLWDPLTHKQGRALFTDNTDRVVRVAFSRDGRTLASASEDGTVRLWDARTHKQLGAPLTDNTDSVVSIALSPDRRLVASGIKDKTIRSWKKVLWRRVAQLRSRPGSSPLPIANGRRDHRVEEPGRARTGAR